FCPPPRSPLSTLSLHDALPICTLACCSRGWDTINVDGPAFFSSSRGLQLGYSVSGIRAARDDFVRASKRQKQKRSCTRPRIPPSHPNDRNPGVCRGTRSRTARTRRRAFPVSVLVSHFYQSGAPFSRGVRDRGPRRALVLRSLGWGRRGSIDVCYFSSGFFLVFRRSSSSIFTILGSAYM